MTGYVICEDKSIAEAISNYRTTADEAARRSMSLNASSKRVFDKSSAVFASDDKDSESEEESDDEVELTSKLKQENFNMPVANEYSNMEGQYHMTHSKINLNDVTFKTMENNILATNHIILCGIVPNLLNFVQPLRAKYLQNYPPIIILHPNTLEEKEWNQIAYFPQIYFVKGNGMNQRDLLRANIKHAKTVVLLSPNSTEVKGQEGIESHKEKVESSIMK